MGHYFMVKCLILQVVILALHQSKGTLSSKSCLDNEGKCLPKKKCKDSVNTDYTCPSSSGKKKVCCITLTGTEPSKSCLDNEGKCLPRKKCKDSVDTDYTCPSSSGKKKVCCIKGTSPSKSCVDNGGKCLPKKKCKDSVNTDYTCPGKKKVCCIKAALPTTTPPPLQGKCDGGEKIGQQCLYVSMTADGIQTWNNAVSACEKKKGVLATLKDPKAVFLKLENSDYWVNGSSDISIEGSGNCQCVHPEVGYKELNCLYRKYFICDLGFTTDVDETVAPTTEDPTTAALTTEVQVTEVPTTSGTLDVRCIQSNGFLSPSKDQCFVFNEDEGRTWDAAQSYCVNQELQLAKPKDHNAVWLRKYVVNTYGSGSQPWGGSSYTWVGAHGDGTHVRWVRDQEILATDNNLWFTNHPKYRVTTDYCLGILTRPTNIDTWPNSPYYSTDCADARRTLCELV